MQGRNPSAPLLLHPPPLAQYRRRGDVSSRLLSVLCSLVAIAFLYDITSRLHGKTVALWAALLMAIAVPQIEYAQATRNYAFLLMSSLAACSSH